jgi:hypothetical protein
MSNIPKLLMSFKSIFLEFGQKMPVTSIIALMRCTTYMKIISKNAGKEHLKIYKSAFDKAGIFPFVVEKFEEYSKGRLLPIKILNYFTLMCNDIPDLYFQNLNGVRLEPLLKYATQSEENSADTEILLAHCQFISSACFTLFESQPKDGD